MMKRFTVTEDHLKLLRRAYVGWDGTEFGAPAIDCKRPYGNSSVYHDIAEILGIKPEGPDKETFSREQRFLMLKLHEETRTVLQIALIIGRFEAGEYEEVAWHQWRKVEQ